MAHRGPIEDGTWPERLQGHVVDPGPPVRVHGYAAVEDLARHHGFPELTLLAFTGELPSSEQVAMCELAWSLLAPIDVGASNDPRRPAGADVGRAGRECRGPGRGHGE